MKPDNRAHRRGPRRSITLGLAALLPLLAGVVLPSAALARGIEVRARVQPDPLILRCEHSVNDRDVKIIPWAVLQRRGESRESWQRRNERLRNGRDVIRRLMAKGYRKERDIKEQGIVSARLVLQFRVEVRTRAKLEFQVEANEKGAVRTVSISSPEAQMRTQPSGIRDLLSRETRERVVQGFQGWRNRQTEQMQSIHTRLSGKKTRWRDDEWDRIRTFNRGTFTRDTSFPYCGNRYEFQTQIKWRNPKGLIR
ncbi:MAG: hypothetical protein ACE5JI_11480 [Acidobacteriota bacterium]